MTEHPVSFRLDSATVARLDTLAEALTVRAAGATVNRSSVLRLAVERGVTALEAELSLAKKRKR
jgi:predicted transcriptional regulator